MGDVEYGCMGRIHNGTDLLFDLYFQGWVQSGKRFVQKQKIRFCRF